MLLILLVLVAVVIVWNIVHFTIKTESSEAQKLSTCIISRIDIEKIGDSNQEFIIKRRGGGDLESASVKLIVDEGSPKKLTEVCTGLTSEPDFRSAFSSVKCIFSQTPTKSIEAFLEIGKSICHATGKIEITPLPEIPPVPIPATGSECSDGMDNENDGMCDYNGCNINNIDYLPDPECTGPEDDSESPDGGGGDGDTPPTSEGWDLESATLEHTIDISDVSYPMDIAFNPDGTKMYILEEYKQGSNPIEAYVHQYSLSKNWDVSSANFDYSTEIGKQTPDPPSYIPLQHLGFAFNDYGTKMYVLKYPRSVYQYSLNPDWDIANAKYDGIKFDIVDDDNNDNYYASMTFDIDGKNMYLYKYIGSFQFSTYQYSLNPDWDISSAKYENIKFTDNRDWHDDLAFKSDGTMLYIYGSYHNYVYQYSLTSKWDISSAKYDNVRFNTNSDVKGFTFSSDGKKLYTVGFTNALNGRINQYSTSS